MGIPFALSISHFINTVGADAGFASIIGLAILVLLYFAQMRETATLRDQATEAAERMRQLEGRLGQLHRAQAASAQAIAASQAAQPVRQPSPVTGFPGRVPAPALASAPVPSAVPRSAPAAPLIAPAGVGAPALSDATKLIPTEAGEGGGVAVAPPPSIPAPLPFDVESALPRPATPAGGSGGSNGSGIGLTGDAGAPPRVQIRPGPSGGRRAPAPQRGLPLQEREPSRARPVVYGVAGLILLAAIVVALLTLTGGSSTPKPAPVARTTNTPTAPAHHKKGPKAAKLSPASISVAVLNGTSTFHLADDVDNKLLGYGFKKGAVTNATDQTHTTTQVEYMGAGNRNAALDVAEKLGLGAGTVGPADSSSLQVCAAKAQTGTCQADVIVTVGTDLNSVASSASASGAPANTISTG